MKRKIKPEEETPTVKRKREREEDSNNEFENESDLILYPNGTYVDDLVKSESYLEQEELNTIEGQHDPLQCKLFCFFVF